MQINYSSPAEWKHTPHAIFMQPLFDGWSPNEFNATYSALQSIGHGPLVCIGLIACIVI
jgi:hypothetical protein